MKYIYIIIYIYQFVYNRRTFQTMNNYPKAHRLSKFQGKNTTTGTVLQKKTVLSTPG